MATGFIDSDEEWLARRGGDGSAEGNFAMADGYNRMANSEVEAYNSRPDPDDWDGDLRHQEEQDRVQAEQRRNAALAQQINANRGVYDGYAQMGNTIAARQAQYVNNANAHLASALRLAAENNGRLPQYAWQGLGAALGLDGKNGAIMGGGYDKKGGFSIMVARQNPQTGQIEQALKSFTPQEQYSLMCSAPGIFSRQEVDGMRGQLINNYGMHPDQVPEVPQGWGETGNVGIGNRTAGGGTSVNPNWLYGPQRRSSISAFGSDGRGGFTQYESNEGTGYQLQSRDFGTRERTWDGMSERERVARINAASRERQAQTDADAKIAAAEARGAGRGTGVGTSRGTSAAGGQQKLDKEWLAAIERRIKETADTVEDDDGKVVDNPGKNPEMNKRLREVLDSALLSGSVGGQREAENSVPPPQQRLVHYRDAQGNLKSGNGYVMNGKVYDAEGNQIEGANVTSPKLERMRAAMAERRGAAERMEARQEGSKEPDRQGQKFDLYDTSLTEEEERQFQEWRATLPKPLQYDGDYDLRGYWKDPDTQKMGIQDGAHFTDKYKKPNHPTFSNESQYATGKNAAMAGHWEGDRYVSPWASSTEAGKKQGEPVPEKERRKRNAAPIRDAQREERVRGNPGTIAEQSAALGKRVGEALSDYAGDVGYVASETARKLGEGYQTGELGTEPAFRYDANSGRNAAAGSKEETLPPKKKKTRQNARVRRSTDSGPTFRADLQRQRASDVARREREEADRERWERLDARLAELQAERDEAARQKRQGREWSAREKKYQQDLRLAMKERDRIQKLYESGDVDAIRKHEQEVNELEALVSELMGEE